MQGHMSVLLRELHSSPLDCVKCCAIGILRITAIAQLLFDMCQRRWVKKQDVHSSRGKGARRRCGLCRTCGGRGGWPVPDV